MKAMRDNAPSKQASKQASNSLIAHFLKIILYTTSEAIFSYKKL